MSTPPPADQRLGWIERRRHPRRSQPVTVQAARMTPVQFDGCFGWFHPPAEVPAGRRAGPGILRPARPPVVLCPALGREARWAHRTMRKLADRLAEAGLATLRFDYPGTGDSRDLPDGDEPLAAWRDSVHAAADWMRAQTGAGQVVLAGIRLGALLAADAASMRGDVAALALLAPVVSGRTYVRELKAMARVARHAEADPDGGIELDGFHLPDATLRGLARLELAATAAEPSIVPPQVLVLEAGGQTASYAAQLRDRDVDVTATEFADYAALMCSATANRVPYGALARTVEWLDRLVPNGSPAVGSAVAAAAAPRFAVPDAVLRLPGCVEQPLRFGQGGHLFGMLCRPESGTMPEFAVVIGNTGGDPHHGIGRFSVMLARRLAAEGMASLRLDFAGLGDSIRGADDDAGHIFDTDRRPDITEALDALARLGVRRFGVTGICTGAYHGLHAAVADQRIDTLALINMVTFAWRKGDAVEAESRSDNRSTRFYKEGLKRVDNWRRLLRGQVDVRRILGALAKRARRRLASAGAHLAERLGAGTMLGLPRSTMRNLSQRGARVLMLMSFEDSSVDALEEHFGAGGTKFAAMPGATVRIERDIDHNLSNRRMRAKVVDVLAAHFGGVEHPTSTDAPARPDSPAVPDHPTVPTAGAPYAERREAA